MLRKSCLVISDLDLHTHMYICIQDVDVICPSDLSYTCTVCIDYKRLTTLTRLAQRFECKGLHAREKVHLKDGVSANGSLSLSAKS